MERWHRRVAVVTGASSGIGAAIALDLARSGMIVVALARREQRLIKLRDQLDAPDRAQFYVLKCDVTNEQDVKRAFAWVHQQLGTLHVLVNNAGVLRKAELLHMEHTADIRATLETNVMGVYYCTREAFNLMRKCNIDDGHIFVINSVAGHQTVNLPSAFPSLNIYPATKHAITSMVEVYRQELLRHNTKIRITSISPGVVETEIFPDDMSDLVGQLPTLKCADISSAVLYALAAPSHVQIHELVIKPVGEIF